MGKEERVTHRKRRKNFPKLCGKEREGKKREPIREQGEKRAEKVGG